MKYGKTERISGIVILLALLAIVVPWLMSDPAPREERPLPYHHHRSLYAW